MLLALNAFVEAVALVAVIEITARAWAGRFLSPLWAAAALAAAILTAPVWWGVGLGQIQLLMLAAIVFALADRTGDRPLARGIALALPVAIKPFPGLLALHLLIERRTGVVAWFALGTIGLAGLGVVVGGAGAFAAYLAALRELSGNVIVGIYNQSFVASVVPTRSGVVAVAQNNWSAVATTFSMVLAVASALAGGLMARKPGRQGEGACCSLVGVTMFAPLAWDHYYVVLIPAVMVLMQRPRPWRVLASGAIFALSLLPVSAFQSWSATPHLTFRPLFLASLIALAALAAAAFEAAEQTAEA